MIGALDEIVEFVDTHSLDIASMLSSKDNEEFKDKLVHWKDTLKKVDAVI